MNEINKKHRELDFQEYFDNFKPYLRRRLLAAIMGFTPDDKDVWCLYEECLDSYRERVWKNKKNY